MFEIKINNLTLFCKAKTERGTPISKAIWIKSTLKMYVLDQHLSNISLKRHVFILPAPQNNLYDVQVESSTETAVHLVHNI